ncbi:Myosin head, partial [Trypanosoma melophagium]|uniref:Myosin head n=1 Tax=Trypanosoma melophagium TaxID=715481 RepID=UPI00351A5883
MILLKSHGFDCSIYLDLKIFLMVTHLNNYALIWRMKHCKITIIALFFTRDMDECCKEGINTESVVFHDNQPCLDLICGLDFLSCGPNVSSRITNKMSILHLVDEESALAKVSDLSFRKKICDLYGDRLLDGKGGHSNFLTVKTDRNSFIVKHYAGDVVCNVDGFRAKNSDATKESLKEAILS